MPEDGTVAPKVSVEFEVFGNVQGCYFTKYCKDQCDRLGIYGWVKNTRSGTIVGKLQGDRDKVDEISMWLSKQGSPGCRIDQCELRNWELVVKPDFRNFSIRF
ncbi:unnamed protein product [Notodromas monacha]|uniref:acylphosphatase n=1 Tax=Notodromas monacha TaxID=399045 RepID=A0A7R9BEC6_9CRUS|nr:unnamed protein product [Notodromas monacha]CAG0912587.1 unnamed protein product [Notodromas monacha]